jgi:homoserine trans-succinylase
MFDEEITTKETTEEMAEEVIEETAEEVVEETPVETKDNKNSLLEDLLKERKKRQEYERKVREYEQRVFDDEIFKDRERIKQQYLEDGFNDEDSSKIAERESDRIKKMKQELNSINTTMAADNEIKELVGSDEFYSDAEYYKKEIIEKMKSNKCDAETAYMLIRGKERRREYQTTIEQRLLTKKEEVISKQVPSSSPSKPSNLYPLDDSDKKALKNLQKADPKGKWTEEKFYKIKRR